MKILLLTLFVCFVFAGSYAQDKKNAVGKKAGTISQRKVYDIVEDMPEPRGGIAKFSKLITENLTYPDSCDQPGGRVIISFIVEADGKITGETIVRDPCGKHHLLSDKLFDIIKKIKWTPGKMKGKPVAVRYSLPMFIYLAGDD